MSCPEYTEDTFLFNIYESFRAHTDINTFSLIFNQEPNDKQLNNITSLVWRMISYYTIYNLHVAPNEVLMNKFLFLIEKFKNYILPDEIMKCLHSSSMSYNGISEECVAYILHKVDVSHLTDETIEKAIEICISVNYPIHHLLEILPEDSEYHSEEFRAQFQVGNIDVIRDPKYRLLKDEV